MSSHAFLALFNQALGLIGAHPHLAYAAAALSTFFEALAVVGVFFPGSVLILGLGALVPSGVLALTPLVIATAAGAVLGDLASYAIGRRYRRAILRLWPLRNHRRWVARGRLLFRRKGAKSIFLARFVRGVHAVVPLLAGVMRMSLLPFVAMDLLSAAVWAPLHVMLGVAVGASLALASAVAGRLALFAAVFGGVLWLAVWAVRRLLRWCGPRLSALERRLQGWSAQRPGQTAGLVRSLLNPQVGELRGLLALLGLLVGGAWLFGGVVQDMVAGDPLVRTDVAVLHLMQALRTTWADAVMIRITELGDATVVVGVVLAGALWLVYRRAWRALAHWVAAPVLAELLTFVFKITLRVARPEAAYQGWERFSFPSGHATVSTALYAFLAFLAVRELKPRRQGPVIAAVAGLVTLIDLSRLYLGVHWLADVVAGSALGVAVSAVLAIGYRHHATRPIGGGRLLLVAFSALALFGAWHSVRRYPADQQRYAPQVAYRHFSAVAWWRSAWRRLPARRVDLAGGNERPLDLQWAGTLPALRRELEGAGWHTPRSWGLGTTLRWLSTSSTASELPVLPQMNNGEPAALVMIRAPKGEGSRSRWVLRVWRAHVRLSGGRARVTALWLGAVTMQTLHHPLHLFSMVRSRSRPRAASSLLVAQLGRARVVRRSKPPGARLVLAYQQGLLSGSAR